MEDPVEAALQMVKLVAVDPPISMVTRLISSYQQVTSCWRDRSENLSTFVLRFRRLAAEHLLHANASSSSQIGEVLAITLLNNANLGEGTLTNAKLQLISHAEARISEKEKYGACVESVPKEGLLELQKLNDQLHSLDAPSCESDMSPTDFKKALMDYR